MTFLEFLIENKGKRIFVDPCSGNNGDLLIWYGMKEALRKSEVKVIDDFLMADLIIINGGGMFIDAYEQGISKIRYYSEMCPNVPLCIAPNSFYFELVDFGKILDEREGSLYLFSREEYSKSYIDNLASSRSHVFSYIDHDLAFQLFGSKWVKCILDKYPKPIAGNVLVVDRMDIENSKVGGKSGFLKKIYIAFVPEKIKSALRKKRVDRRDRLGSDFTEFVRDFLSDQYASYEIKSIISKDISRNDICDFEEFIRLVAEAEYVFSNRLHVGVLGYLLDRKVYVKEGSYHKIRGIYEYSMKHDDSIKLIDSI